MATLVTPDGFIFERRPVDQMFPARLEALAGGTCHNCGQSVLDKEQWEESDLAEYLISATCPPCFTAMFSEGDEDDEDDIDE